MTHRSYFAILLLVLLALPAHAQQRVYYKLSSGTGFIVNRDGNVVTNAHVVTACQSISILTPDGEQPATLVASDTKQDLAVLKTAAYYGKNTAPLRWNISDLRTGDPVIVIGYPGEEGSAGHVQIKRTSVTALKGPSGEEKWIQLASVAQHGNSGGPVLDTTGNVIAVISGMALTYRVDPDGQISKEAIGQSDIAITLLALQDFLRENHINFYESNSGLVAYAEDIIAENSRSFIVPVHCIQGLEKR